MQISNSTTPNCTTTPIHELEDFIYKDCILPSKEQQHTALQNLPREAKGDRASVLETHRKNVSRRPDLRLPSHISVAAFSLSHPLPSSSDRISIGL